MQQISDAIEQLDLEQKLVISIGDSLYSTECCRKQVSGHDNWVHKIRQVSVIINGHYGY